MQFLTAIELSAFCLILFFGVWMFFSADWWHEKVFGHVRFYRQPSEESRVRGVKIAGAALTLMGLLGIAWVTASLVLRR